jgi:hypothetical protein
MRFLVEVSTRVKLDGEPLQYEGDEAQEALWTAYQQR